MYLEGFQKNLERALIELNMYGILAQLVEHLTFNQVVRGSNPRCLMRKMHGNASFFCCSNEEMPEALVRSEKAGKK
jgi:hypothetical protein